LFQTSIREGDSKEIIEKGIVVLHLFAVASKAGNSIMRAHILQTLSINILPEEMRARLCHLQVLERIRTPF